MAKGLIIAFSGIDGAGKSTQIQTLLRRLQQSGYHAHYLWTRGGYTSAFEGMKRLARRVLRRKLPPVGHTTERTQALKKTWVRRLWLILAQLDLMRVYGLQLRWWRWRGQVIVCDRYLLDTLIDFQLNFSDDSVRRWWLWRCLTAITRTPDLALMLLIPVEESIHRSDIKQEPFRDSALMLERRLSLLQSLAEKEHYRIIDGLRTEVEVADEIWEVFVTRANSDQSAASQASPNVSQR